MSLARILRTLLEKRRLDRSIAARRAARTARSDAAKRGNSASLKRRGEQARAILGEYA